MFISKVLSITALLVGQSSAHGAVTSYQIGNTVFPGYQGYSPSSSPKSIQRQWTDGYNPITSVTSEKMLCNGGTSAALAADIVAGETITAKWSQWTHSQGPVMVWMYKCAGEHSSCDGKSKGWFKIDQLGMTAAPLSGTAWGNDIVLKKLAWTSTIPKSLAPGNYLIRHELLALHQANSPQFYPECAQLKVSGSGTATPAASFLTSIPGYATASDPGVMVDTYMSKATTYTPPGPAVWTG
ncbi:related to cel1 protein precursor [Rhynchosporium agropyri]|uniref:AA9 family lytic polysaccharide monooxygenase n=2 Tax=Rhynchosporium TaxID=38037 RepID=A0A1E1K6I1_9HELO|nr:related to cel1 protein precursor [Rhynchosporium agropyri]CZT13243.1 related to cel1 protein precursor [Rhynchosporium commune]